jgi:hypothetical protein
MIIGIMGNAGAGKGELARIFLKELGGYEIALADPIKEFCKDVFQFTDSQLWGPSEMRQKPDTRYSIKKPKCWFGLHNSERDLAILYREGAIDRCERYADKWLDLVLPPHIDRPKAYWKLHRIIQVIVKEEVIAPRLCLQKIGTDWGKALYSDIWIEHMILRIQTLAIQGFGGPAIVTDVRFVDECKAIKEAGGVVVGITRPGQPTYKWTGYRSHRSEQEQFSEEMRPHIDMVFRNDGTVQQLRQKVISAIRQ